MQQVTIIKSSFNTVGGIDTNTMHDSSTLPFTKGEFLYFTDDISTCIIAPLASRNFVGLEISRGKCPIIFWHLYGKLIERIFLLMVISQFLWEIRFPVFSIKMVASDSYIEGHAIFGMILWILWNDQVSIKCDHQKLIHCSS